MVIFGIFIEKLFIFAEYPINFLHFFYEELSSTGSLYLLVCICQTLLVVQLSGCHDFYKMFFFICRRKGILLTMKENWEEAKKNWGKFFTHFPLVTKQNKFYATEMSKFSAISNGISLLNHSHCTFPNITFNQSFDHTAFIF